MLSVYAAHAEVRVEGNTDSVRIEARDAAVADVLSALADRFRVRYRTSLPLGDAISLTYTGPLEQAIARALGSFNYVLKKENETVEVIVLGRHGSRAVAVEAPKPAPDTPAARWRTNKP